MLRIIPELYYNGGKKQMLDYLNAYPFFNVCDCKMQNVSFLMGRPHG